MRKLIGPGLACLLALASPGRGWADAVVTRTQLESWGIQPAAFRLMVESGNGKTLIGKLKELDLRQRALGMGYKMCVFRLDGTTIAPATIIPLPLTIWDQAVVNDDGTRCIVSGELGTKILEVDLVAKTYRVIMENKKGQPGFRNDPRIAWTDGQSTFMTGYFYDGEGVSGADVVARCNTAVGGAGAFEKMVETRPIEKQTSPRFMQRIIMSPEQAVFMGPFHPGHAQVLRVYDKGKVAIVDQGVVFGTLAATTNRVLYSIRRFGTTIQHQETWVKDFESGQKWQVGKTDVPYLYGFIARDGKTIAISNVDLRGHHLSMFYAREADGFALKPIAGLQNVPLGNFRFAAQGTGWAWNDDKGLRMGTLP